MTLLTLNFVLLYALIVLFGFIYYTKSSSLTKQNQKILEQLSVSNEINQKMSNNEEKIYTIEENNSMLIMEISNLKDIISDKEHTLKKQRDNIIKFNTEGFGDIWKDAVKIKLATKLENMSDIEDIEIDALIVGGIYKYVSNCMEEVGEEYTGHLIIDRSYDEIEFEIRRVCSTDIIS